MFALFLLLRFFYSILNPTLLDIPSVYASLYSDSLPTLVGLVPYGWWPPIHSRTYPRTTLLKLLSTNVRSLLPKTDDLRGLCCHEHFDIIVASETWLSNAILALKCHLGLQSPYSWIQPHKEGSKSAWRWCCYLCFFLHPLQTAPTPAQ